MAQKDDQTTGRIMQLPLQIPETCTEASSKMYVWAPKYLDRRTFFYAEPVDFPEGVFLEVPSPLVARADFIYSGCRDAWLAWSALLRCAS